MQFNLYRQFYLPRLKFLRGVAFLLWNEYLQRHIDMCSIEYLQRFWSCMCALRAVYSINAVYSVDAPYAVDATQ